MYSDIIFILLNIGLFALFRSGTNTVLNQKKWTDITKNMLESKRYEIVGRKLNIYQKFKIKSIEVLRLSNSKMTYGQYLRVIGLFVIGGVIIGLLLNNILLSFVLAVCMALAPMQYLIFKQSSYQQYINEQMETVLAIVTNAYLQSDDIVQAIKDNMHRIEQPFLSVFKEFVASKTFIDSNIKKNIRQMKAKIDNEFFNEWCDILILCQNDRELKYVLPTIIEKMSDVKQIQAELNTMMYNIYKDHISVTLVVAANIPLMKFLNADWYRLLTTTFAGQIIVAITFAVIFISTAYVVKVNKPVSLL